MFFLYWFMGLHHSRPINIHHNLSNRTLERTLGLTFHVKHEEESKWQNNILWI